MQDFWMLLKLDKNFMTKDTAEFSQFHAVACREYTLPREEEASQPTGWTQGNKIEPVLKAATCFLHGKYGVEIRISSVNRQIFTPGSEFFMDQTSLWWIWKTMSRKFQKFSSKSLRYNWMRRILHAEHGLKKTTKKRTCWLFTKNLTHGKKELDRFGTRETFPLRVRGIEESNSSSSSLTESTSRRRWSGSFLENQRKYSESIHTICSLVWRSMDSMFGSRRRKQEKIPVLYWWFRNNCWFPSSSGIFRTQSYRSFIIGQSDYSEQLFPLPCWLCVQFTFHHQIRIDTWRSNFEQQTDRQTVFFLLVDSMDKNHKDPDTINLNVPRHAQHMHKRWKRHQNAEYWVDVNLAMEKGLKFYQTRSNAIFLHETLPACCIPKVVRMETGAVFYVKVYMSRRLPPKISLKHDWRREMGSEHARRPEEQVVQQSTSSQSNQPITNPGRDQTGQLVVGTNTRTV